MEWIIRANRWLSELVFGPATLMLLLGTGVLFTLRSSFFQLRHAGLWLRCTCLGALRGGRRRKRLNM